jgi:hypothetical protein
MGLFTLLMVPSVRILPNIIPLSNNNGQIEFLNLNTMKLDITGNGSVETRKTIRLLRLNLLYWIKYLIGGIVYKRYSEYNSLKKLIMKNTIITTVLVG